MPANPRYAIYFTPKPGSPLASFGAGVIGYDPATNRDVPFQSLDGISAQEHAIATAAPRKYGFHATLVAPFYLRDRDERGLRAALQEFCGGVDATRIGALQVAALDDFIALTPRAAAPAVDDFARRCVEFFDRFRAPLSADDLARRDHARLSPRQRIYLGRWGYPYVFDDFRFHMTLTGVLTPAEKNRFLSALARAYAPLARQNYRVDALSLMRQSRPDARFEMVARWILRGPHNGAPIP